MLALSQPATKRTDPTTDKETFEKIGSYGRVSPLKKLICFQVVRHRKEHIHILFVILSTYVFDHRSFYTFLCINLLVKLSIKWITHEKKEHEKKLELLYQEIQLCITYVYVANVLIKNSQKKWNLNYTFGK